MYVLILILILKNDWSLIEMIKGIRIGSSKQNFKYYDMLEIPIIENTAEEQDLKDRMNQVRETFRHVLS